MQIRRFNSHTAQATLRIFQGESERERSFSLRPASSSDARFIPVCVCVWERIYTAKPAFPREPRQHLISDCQVFLLFFCKTICPINFLIIYLFCINFFFIKKKSKFVNKDYLTLCARVHSPNARTSHASWIQTSESLKTGTKIYTQKKGIVVENKKGVRGLILSLFLLLYMRV